jgi:hypothetical protein
MINLPFYFASIDQDKIITAMRVAWGGKDFVVTVACAEPKK